MFNCGRQPDKILMVFKPDLFIQMYFILKIFLYNFYHKFLSGTLLVYARRMKTVLSKSTKVTKTITYEARRVVILDRLSVAERFKDWIRLQQLLLQFTLVDTTRTSHFSAHARSKH